ncbi:MAG: hypothetical protein ACPGRY_01490, partial [Candidatus Latescibacterota bacterium]
QRDKIMSNKLPQNKVDPMDRYVETFCRFGIPLRNNHLTHAEPAELRHGNRQYHYNGYLWWSDQIDPTYSEYSLQTTRPADFYWSINQTRIYLQAADHSGVLHVLLEHTMPNFSHFAVQVDGAEWQELREVEMEWKLQSGPNRLAVRAVNVFGREGRTSHAEIACER